ncbi:putative membrane protein YccC [Frigoribacterium sp. PvP120]|uniref:hypothetical protein n=1 Tax=unclassified Frigoribacterium TaxID=2627005 RepID=UPI001AE20A4C|nr:hypothetical protein [Frigoribacterium sp. PvP121]MBP1242305.1 putative membrane protein YccC [Frigoribacterium sp. PvP121]
MTAFWLLLGVWPVVSVVALCVAPRARTWRRLGGLLAASVVLLAAGVATLIHGDTGVGIILCGNALAGALVAAVTEIVVELGSAAGDGRDSRPTSRQPTEDTRRARRRDESPSGS